MAKALKNIGFFLVTIILTAAIFWLVFIDKESKQNVLEYSLGLLGEKLMAMMPDSADTKPIQALYEDFVEKAKNKEVPPYRIENVAATILNLSNIDTIVTPREAEAMIKLSLAEPVKIERVLPESQCTGETKPLPEFVAVYPPPPKQGKEVPAEAWAIAAERIKSAYEFNTEYQKAMREYYKKRHDQQYQMTFKVEDGLRIAIDTNLKQQFDQKKYRRLKKEMQDLEKRRIIVWRRNFREEMRQEMERRRHELESLKQLKQLEHLKELEGLKALESLEALKSLKSLEALQYLPVVNADSIRIIVEKSLEEAGVKK